MKNSVLSLTALLILTALIAVSIFGVYGLASTKSAEKTDALVRVVTEPIKSVGMLPTEVPTKAGTGPLPLPIPVPAVTAPAFSTARDTTLNLQVFGKTIDLTGTPIVQAADGKTMLPLRKLGEALGYTVKWDNLIRAAILQKDNESVIIKNDSLNYTWGTLSRVFSKKTEMFKNRLYVPVDFITGNSVYQLNQTTASITIDLAGSVAKLALTGEIKEITVYTNGLELVVEDNKNDVSLFVTDQTLITNYTTGAAIAKSLLKTGTKAIFSYTAVAVDGQKSYNVLSSIEVVELADNPAPAISKPIEIDN